MALPTTRIETKVPAAGKLPTTRVGGQTDRERYLWRMGWRPGKDGIWAKGAEPEPGFVVGKADKPVQLVTTQPVPKVTKAKWYVRVKSWRPFRRKVVK